MLFHKQFLSIKEINLQRMICLYSKALCRGADGLINGSVFFYLCHIFLEFENIKIDLFLQAADEPTEEKTKGKKGGKK